MKRRKAYDNKTVLAIVAIILIVGYVLWRSKLSVRTFRGSAKHVAQQRRVLLLYHTDHEALLKAGREILRQGPKDPWNYRPLGPVHIDGFPVPGGVRIPKVIRKLRPHATLINFNGFVVLRMEWGVAGFGVKIYPEGFSRPRRDFRYGNRELLPGLWYFDDRYNNDPEYNRRIDEIIQKGRWEESNKIDLSKS